VWDGYLGCIGNKLYGCYGGVRGNVLGWIGFGGFISYEDMIWEVVIVEFI
jgi:hypothetical protein